MHKHLEETAILALVISLLALFPGAVLSESFTTITGVISEDGQLFGNDGVIYKIAENEIGLELIEMIDNKVEVRGRLISVDDAVIIVVEEFEVVRK